MTDAIALLNAFDSPSEHLRWFFVFETHPPSSAAHELVPPSLQSKCCPGPGGVANAPPAPSKKMPPIAAPRMRFMSPPPLGLVRWPLLLVLCLVRGGLPKAADMDGKGYGWTGDTRSGNLIGWRPVSSTTWRPRPERQSTRSGAIRLAVI